MIIKTVLESTTWRESGDNLSIWCHRPTVSCCDEAEWMNWTRAAACLTRITAHMAAAARSSHISYYMTRVCRNTQAGCFWADNPNRLVGPGPWRQCSVNKRPQSDNSLSVKLWEISMSQERPSSGLRLFFPTLVSCLNTVWMKRSKELWPEYEWKWRWPSLTYFIDLNLYKCVQRQWCSNYPSFSIIILFISVYF